MGKYMMEMKSMGSLINIGFGNIINFEKVIAIVSPDSAPVKRVIQNAKDEGTAIDATQGRRTRAVVIMENSSIILSAIQPETIANRYEDTNQVRDHLDPLLKKKNNLSAIRYAL